MGMDEQLTHPRRRGLARDIDLTEGVRSATAQLAVSSNE